LPALTFLLDRIVEHVGLSVHEVARPAVLHRRLGRPRVSGVDDHVGLISTGVSIILATTGDQVKGGSVGRPGIDLDGWKVSVRVLSDSGNPIVSDRLIGKHDGDLVAGV
jgi:hypothetical protein